MKILNLIISIIVLIISVVIGGIVVRYGWNSFITQISSVPTITLPVAIGIDLTVTYITGYATPFEFVKTYEKLDGIVKTLVMLTTNIGMSVITFVVMYVVTLFM